MVPANIPTEPNAARCGDSYPHWVDVTGLIPGTDFGADRVHELSPVVFHTSDGPTTDAPLLDSYDAVVAAVATPAQRFDDVEDIIKASAFRAQDRKTLLKLVRRGRQALRKAKGVFESVHGFGFPEEAQDYLRDALQHLRCVEYWTWRITLYNESLELYEPPKGPAFKLVTGELLPKLPDIPDAATEPGVEPTQPGKTQKGMSPWWIIGGAVLTAGIVWYAVKR